ncbi:class I SAM-dependent methyltransferase [Thiocapsa marina]|uniref:Class I SAM-dependent methyltransferase n=1 Tax=Thiocapsa marina 5811 TaxID=768671 RepID=F9UEY3_9GAMM|nr:class I SAM-dependent methyltransferase [Thiocapsa marina]EGV17454.1 hypothetical protein ThimaDRAFT_3486 [Thiocapsa marina 5811]
MNQKFSKAAQAPPDLERLVSAANGMLPMSVYREIYKVATGVAGGRFVEVGTAHGAATIAIALGAGVQERIFSVWSVDQLGGRFSSRRAFGSPEDNARIIEGNLGRANVLDSVRVFVGSSEEFVTSEACPKEIDFLLLDADGRIDRDLGYFYPRMSPGSPIVIDDVDEQVYLSRDHDGVPYIDLKHRVSNLLLKAYESRGFLRVRYRLENTAFCERGEAIFDSETFAEIAIGCYRQLVFSSVREPIWDELTRWKEDVRDVRLAMRVWETVPPSVWAGLRRVRRSVVSLLGRSGN